MFGLRQRARWRKFEADLRILVLECSPSLEAGRASALLDLVDEECVVAWEILYSNVSDDPSKFSESQWDAVRRMGTKMGLELK